MCKNRDLKLPLALRCGLSPPSWLLTLLMPVSMPSVLAWNKCFIWLGTCSSRLFVADTKWASQIFDLLALSCFIIYVFGVVWYFRVLRFEHNFCRCEPCLPVFGAWGARCQCSVNPYMCSESNSLLFVHAAYSTSWKIKAALSLGWGILKGFCK